MDLSMTAFCRAVYLRSLLHAYVSCMCQHLQLCPHSALHYDGLCRPQQPGPGLPIGRAAASVHGAWSPGNRTICCQHPGTAHRHMHWVSTQYVARCHAQLHDRWGSLMSHCHVRIKGLLLPADFQIFEHTTLQRAALSKAVTAAALCIRTSAGAATADDQPCLSDCC